jgi:hypothetical protein
MSNNLLTLSIDDYKIKLVEFSYRNGKLYIENIDEEYFEELLNFNEKETKIHYLLKDAINELMLRKKAVTRNVSIALPTKYFYIIKIPYEKKLSLKDLNNYLKWELRVIYPELINRDIIVQNIKLDDKYCIAIAIERHIINKIRTFVEFYNFELKIVENEHLAFNRFVKKYPKVDNSNYLILYVGIDYFTISYNSINNIIEFRSYKYSELSEVIEKTHNFYNQFIKTNDLFVNLYITGSNISDTFIKHFEATNTFILRRVNPFEGIQYNPKLINSKLYTLKNYAFAVNVALIQ